MGFVRKLTGADAQVKAMNKQADNQIKAAKDAANAQVAALNASAQAAAEAQRTAADRANVERVAAESASQPMAVADVVLDIAQPGSAATGRRKTRAQFGTGYSSDSGVSI